MPLPLSGPPPRSLRIFIVENHPDTREYLQLYLEVCGHAVLSAGSVDEALANLPDAHCDVLISDIGLSDGTGWDLLGRLHLPNPIFAIAMSGFGLNADRARSLEAGFRHHLLKPFSMEDLDTILEAAAHETPVVH